MADQAKNIMIGLFVIAACTVIVFILLFLHPTAGDEGKVLRVRFTDIDKVNVGTRVTYAGKPVGEVTHIKEVERGRKGKTDESGGIYTYELTLAVDSSVDVYNTDQISLRTSGLLGERSVAVTPFAAKPGELLFIVNKETIYATQAGSVENTLRELKGVAGKIDIALDSITTTINEFNSKKIWDKVDATAQNLADITGALNKPQEWSETLQNVHLLSQKVNHSWDHIDQSIEKFDAITRNLVAFTEQSNEIIDKISRGEGTLGKIVASDDLYLRLTSILNRVETVGNDVNHYGLLFHLDKGWQRLRARRMNLLTKLSTPQQFRNYFNDEIDQISTSLSRVSMVLDKTDPCAPQYPLAENREFTKVFAELLRRVSDIEEGLKMYNQQIMDTEVKKTEFIECNY